MIALGQDCRVDTGDLTSVFYLDDKRFIGMDAQRYLRDECGFTNAEAVSYLVSLSAAANSTPQ
jgi:hypothetical protein